MQLRHSEKLIVMYSALFFLFKKFSVNRFKPDSKTYSQTDTKNGKTYPQNNLNEYQVDSSKFFQ